MTTMTTMWKLLIVQFSHHCHPLLSMLLSCSHYLHPHMHTGLPSNVTSMTMWWSCWRDHHIIVTPHPRAFIIASGLFILNEKPTGQPTSVPIPIPMGLYLVQVWVWVRMLAPRGIPMPLPTSMLTMALICKPQGEVSWISWSGYNLQDKLGWPPAEYKEIWMSRVNYVWACS